MGVRFNQGPKSKIKISSPVDQTTGALETITYPHHEVHSGRHYTFSGSNDSIDDTETLEYILTTPDTTRWSHVLFYIIGALKTSLEIYEDTTHNLGAAQTTKNNNRNSSNTSGTTIHLSAGGGSDGTLMDKISFGVSSGFGTNARAGGGYNRGDSEWILKQNTKYLVRATSGADANNITIIIGWYEHINS